MKKSFQPQWLILLLTAAAAISGTLLRARQLQTELLSDGSLAEGSYLHVILTVITVVLIIGMIALLLPLSKKESWNQVFPANPIVNALIIISAAGLVIGNVLLWMSGSLNEAPIMTQSPEIAAFLSKLLIPLGIVSAVCIIVFAILCALKKKPSPLLYMVASVYLILRLIVRFQSWNTDPSIHDYCFKLLSAICCMLGTFQLAGFSFDKGRRRITVFWTLCAVVFCSISLPDAYLRGTPDDLIIGASLLLLMAVSGVSLLLCKDAPSEETDAPVDEEITQPKSDF